MDINFYEYLSAVVIADDQKRVIVPGDGPAVIVRSIAGTAFSISPTVSITAAHVAKTMATNGNAFLTYYPYKENVLGVTPVNDVELFESKDIALIFSGDIPSRKYFDWNQAIQSFSGIDVKTAGFAYSFDPIANPGLVPIRNFRGHVVCDVPYNNQNLKIQSLELSFHCPKGLSGAPLLDKNLKISGLIIGNKVIDQEIYSEVEKENGKTYSRVEAMHLGMALKVSEILNLHSKKLNSTIGDFIRNNCKPLTLS